MTSISGGNVTLSKDGVSVLIYTFMDEENWTKKLTNITIPKTTENQDINIGKGATKIIDLLLKAERRITVDGFLVTDATSSAETKKSDLRKIFFAGDLITLNYEGVDITGNCDKMNVKRIKTAGVQATDNEAQYVVKFTFLEGVSLLDE